MAFVRRRFGLNVAFRSQLITTTKPGVDNEGGYDDRGLPFVRISLNELSSIIGTNSLVEYEEYDHISSDPVIGNASVNWKQYLARLIAHEIAHTLALGKNNRVRNIVLSHIDVNVFDDIDDHHGKLWQELYRIICEEHVQISIYTTRFVYPYNSLSRDIIHRMDEDHVIYSYEGRQVAFYIMDATGIYLSDSCWKTRIKTEMRDLREVRKSLTS